MKHTNKIQSLCSIFLLFTQSTLFSTTYWKWQNINTHAVQFPASFEWGLTTLTHEVEGYAKQAPGMPGKITLITMVNHSPKHALVIL